jgi:hypothetical protein
VHDLRTEKLTDPANDAVPLSFELLSIGRQRMTGHRTEVVDHRRSVQGGRFAVGTTVYLERKVIRWQHWCLHDVPPGKC